MLTNDDDAAPTSTVAGALEHVALAASVAAALLLVGGVLFALASADLPNTGGDRFRLLGQAANPFIAALAAVAAALVAHERRRPPLDTRQRAPKAALALATAVSLAVVLLALNGVITDLTGSAGGLFRFSAVVSRLGTITLGALGLWIAATAPVRPGTPPPAAG